MIFVICLALLLVGKFIHSRLHPSEPGAWLGVKPYVMSDEEQAHYDFDWEHQCGVFNDRVD